MFSLFLLVLKHKAVKSIQRIKLARIIKENLIRQRAWNVFARSHGGNQLPFLGRILVAIVGADEQMILAGKPRNIIDVDEYFSLSYTGGGR